MSLIKHHFAEIRHFVTVAEMGSFSQAAQVLSMTGSALSKSIVRLETRLGTKLLHRTTRRLSLTNDGDAYLAECQKAMNILHEAESRLGSEQQLPSGRVRIDLPTTFGRRYILPILLDLASKYDQLDLSVTFNDRPTDLLSDGIDLAVRVGPLDDSAGLVARRLGGQRRVICGSPAYFAKTGLPLVKEDIVRHHCIVGWPLGQKHSWLLKNADGTTEACVLNIRHELVDCEAILAATLAGAGLAQMPLWIVEEHLQKGTLIAVLEQYAVEEAPMHLIWLKNSFIQPKLRVVIDELCKVMNRAVNTQV